MNPKLSYDFPVDFLIQKFYPFSTAELLGLNNKLNFKELSKNKNIQWDAEIIEEFVKEWDWFYLSHNIGIKWDSELISRFENYIDWESASLNLDFPWTFKLLDKYKDEISWESVCDNFDVVSDDKIFQKFSTYYSWMSVSYNQKISWSESLLEKFKDKLDWDILSNNTAIPINEKLFEQFKDYWNSSGLGTNPTLLSDKNWDLLKHICEIDFLNVSIFKTDWTIEFIERYKDKLDWQELSQNEHLPWNKGILEKYWDRWDLFLMSGNSKIPWTVELLQNNLTEWNWNRPMPPSGIDMSLSCNEGLPWSFDFLERFGIYIEWDFVNNDSIEDYWERIASIKSLKWDFKHMQKFHKWLTPIIIVKNENFYKAIESHFGKENLLSLL